LEPGAIAMKSNIAVIDDSEIMRDAMVHLLCSAGYGVEQYASAAEFLAAADISQADCLVVDIELGDSLGTEMVRDLWLRGYSVPVIFMTGSPNDVFRQAAKALGCTAFLPKPFPAEDLLQAIDRATARPQGYQKCA
jgi:FixJ family two-component response regulator